MNNIQPFITPPLKAQLPQTPPEQAPVQHYVPRVRARQIDTAATAVFHGPKMAATYSPSSRAGPYTREIILYMASQYASLRGPAAPST